MYVIEVIDNSGGSRLYGPFDSEIKLQNFIRRRWRVKTAPSLKEGNFLVKDLIGV